MASIVTSAGTAAAAAADDHPVHPATERTYEIAIATLDSLTANTIAQQSAASRVHSADNSSLSSTQLFYVRSGLSWSQLDQLAVIHVTGTKGKGSTCALAESVLRACGVRTGFYSSPHLVAVEERFRIDGVPLARDKFTAYFWRVYDALRRTAERPNDMPFYFQFLTVMAAHVFVGERVDCAIVEVGIGGEFDCTNIVRNTRTAGISALGLEHTQMLGDTLAEIAWQKAGIAKGGGECTVWTVQRQPAECAPVLGARCAERGAELRWVPEWSEYRWTGDSRDWTEWAAQANPIYRLNGSLAVQLAYDWMRKNAERLGGGEGTEELLRIVRGAEMCTEVPERVAVGLQRCRWPGRFEVTQYGNCRLFVDGAHTAESVQLCASWFAHETAASASKKFLLFNVTGQRSAPSLLRIIRDAVPIQAALFSPNVARAAPDDAPIADSVLQALCESDADGATEDKVFASVEQVFEYLRTAQGGACDVLVTGSLYMVGAVYELIEAKL